MSPAALQSIQSSSAQSPAFLVPSWWDDPETGNKRDVDCRKVVKAFVTGRFPKRMEVRHNGHWVFTARNGGTELWLFKNNPAVKLRVCVARLLAGRFVGNSSSINAIRYKNHLNWIGGDRTKIQEVLGQVMPMVPFRLFTETKLSIASLEIIEQGPEEWHDLGNWRSTTDKVHFTGEMVFRIAQGDEQQYFLFGIDRNDLARKNRNLFMSRLPRPAVSIADAYDSLKPAEVSEAERFLGRPCPRQGEWFFIPSAHQDVQPKKGRQPWQRETEPARIMEGRLESKGHTPHYTTYVSEGGLVKGKVRHGRGDHAVIELPIWHKPVPNTAVGSFKISGAID